MATMRDPVANFSRHCPDAQERAANMFAMCLLMPEDAVHFMVRDSRAGNIAWLADKFGVSEVAMLERLRQLGYAR